MLNKNISHLQKGSKRMKTQQEVIDSNKSTIKTFLSSQAFRTMGFGPDGNCFFSMDLNSGEILSIETDYSAEADTVSILIKDALDIDKKTRLELNSRLINVDTPKPILEIIENSLT
jgi:hypothetical protein